MKKYNTAGPRYTSYPTAIAFEDINENDSLLENALLSLGKSQDAEKLSLYMHIPFCHSLCYYCGCNKIVTRHAHKADIYLDHLIEETRLRGEQASACTVESLHLGGGTPSFLNAAQLKRLLDATRAAFALSSNIEMSIEVDPREIQLDYADELARLGFNRLSIGVQDVNSKVQESINRTQSTEFIRDFIRHARKSGFESINLDLIYGLPYQNRATFSNTLNEMLVMNPDRISLFSYAHMPQLFAAQRKIKDEWLPATEEKFGLFRQAIDFLCAHGYEFIGMDHFAKPSDSLSKAKREQGLYRNFQGYTTSQAQATLGLGVSSISSINDVYVQNHKALKDYYQCLSSGTTDTGSESPKAPAAKAIKLSEDDVIHRAIIHGLMCNFSVDKATFSEQHNIDFDRYFSASLANLESFIEDSLLSNTSERLVIHDRGRLIVRNICMSFDQYLDKPLHQTRYSRVI
ncbi:oxygen-independent coproporphyrinogen III oxidase [Ningiella sp. W23]|uniref:oxygen-independent coproporphyrinogen III oxidase n=1 Tax=Ningiella sp. W23 TaxID=3023715 RepID=UPI003757311E